jgi:hypothetical protein
MTSVPSLIDDVEPVLVRANPATFLHERKESGASRMVEGHPML